MAGIQCEPKHNCEENPQLGMKIILPADFFLSFSKKDAIFGERAAYLMMMNLELNTE